MTRVAIQFAIRFVWIAPLDPKTRPAWSARPRRASERQPVEERPRPSLRPAR